MAPAGMVLSCGQRIFRQCLHVTGLSFVLNQILYFQFVILTHLREREISHKTCQNWADAAVPAQYRPSSGMLTGTTQQIPYNDANFSELLESIVFSKL